MPKTATRKGVVEGQAKSKRKRTAAKRGPGRPTKFDATYIDQAGKLALLGHTNEEMARFFGVTCTTFDRWFAAHPKFRGAVKEGREVADARVTESLYRRAMGYSHAAVKIMAVDKCVEQVPYTEHYPPDTAACIFWLKNRQKAKWRDRIEQEVSGPDGGPVEVEHAGLVTLNFEAVRAKRGVVADANEKV